MVNKALCNVDSDISRPKIHKELTIASPRQTLYYLSLFSQQSLSSNLGGLERVQRAAQIPTATVPRYTCISQIVVVSWLRVFQTTKRNKWLTEFRKKLMKRLRICTLADICREIMRLISDKYVAQIPKKFSWSLEHQRKTDLEMCLNGVNWMDISVCDLGAERLGFIIFVICMFPQQIAYKSALLLTVLSYKSQWQICILPAVTLRK